MTPFDLALDPKSPVPLYHQIAEALRYRIATGAIRAGAVLPPLREAARAWGVNLHTVRQAYAELAAAGIVATQAPHGTQVLPTGAARSAGEGEQRGRKAGSRDKDAFLLRVIGEARERYGLSLPQLLASLQRHGALSPPAPAGTLRVAECSLSQSADLARQIGERWRVEAVPWPIQSPEPPASDPIVATYFHYNDLRLRWPNRFPEIRFLAISPDPSLAKRLRGRAATGKRASVLLCEREEPMMRNIASDLARILPADKFRVVPTILRGARGALAKAGPHQPVLVSPRIWGDLPQSEREDPRVHEIRYLFHAADLDALGRDLGWAPREEA